jgi:hypothetical protein
MDSHLVCQTIFKSCASLNFIQPVFQFLIFRKEQPPAAMNATSGAITEAFFAPPLPRLVVGSGAPKIKRFIMPK